VTALLRALCIAVPGLALVAAAIFAAGDNGGGFLPHLGRSIALAILAGGVAISWCLNLLYLWHARGPRWLMLVTAVQTLPVLLVAWQFGGFLLNQGKDSRARDQIAAIRTAIGVDDVAAFDRAVNACGDRCLQFIDGHDGMLFLAADTGAITVATRIVSTRLPDHRYTYGHAENSVRTCDGDPVYMHSALAAAVARNNSAMLDLVLPASDSAARREAIWLAARLDRFAMLQRLAAAGVPITVRGQILDENSTLLIAAAEGAAVRMGRWLIEVHHMPVNAILTGPDPYKGSSPVRIVMSGGRDGDAPARIASFLQLLVSHGADIDARWDDDEPSALTEMIRRRDRQGAELLLTAGASKAKLSAERRVQLDSLLLEPAPEHATFVHEPGCVKPGD
jgi:hypothetical protein